MLAGTKKIDWPPLVPELKTMIATGTSVKDIAQHFGVASLCIYKKISQYDLETPRYLGKFRAGVMNPRQRWLYDVLKKKATLEHRRELAMTTDLPTFCPVLGLELRYGCMGPDCASVDQKVPRGGYIPGNIAIMSHRANTLKNNGTLEEFTSLVSYLRLT
jgi:hypothetical protein